MKKFIKKYWEPVIVLLLQLTFIPISMSLFSSNVWQALAYGGAISFITYWPQYFIRYRKESQVEKEKKERRERLKNTCLQLLDLQYLKERREWLPSALKSEIDAINVSWASDKKLLNMYIASFWGHYDSYLDGMHRRLIYIRPYYCELFEDHLSVDVLIGHIERCKDNPDNRSDNTMKKYGIPNQNIVNQLMKNCDEAIEQIEILRRNVHSLA